VPRGGLRRQAVHRGCIPLRQECAVHFSHCGPRRDMRIGVATSVGLKSADCEPSWMRVGHNKRATRGGGWHGKLA
jgi:hypothetical protein